MVGVLQGCVLSPHLFCFFLKVVTAKALEDDDLVVLVSGAQINNLKFADGITLEPKSGDDLQLLITKIDTNFKIQSLKFK